MKWPETIIACIGMVCATAVLIAIVVWGSKCTADVNRTDAEHGYVSRGYLRPAPATQPK